MMDGDDLPDRDEKEGERGRVIRGEPEEEPERGLIEGTDRDIEGLRELNDGRDLDRLEGLDRELKDGVDRDLELNEGIDRDRELNEGVDRERMDGRLKERLGLRAETAPRERDTEARRANEESGTASAISAAARPRTRMVR